VPFLQADVGINIMTKTAKLLCLLFFVIISCNKKQSETETEQQVFDEVFLQVVNKTYTDKRLYTHIPRKGQENDSAFLAVERELKKDTTELVVAVEKTRKIDLNKFTNQKFIFKDFAELPKKIELENWSEKYKKFIGVMSFSKIKFDAKKENGTLNVSYDCGGKCGLGYKVYLKKEKGKWKVVKIEKTWIS
jgi:hypothetical protein